MEQYFAYENNRKQWEKPIHGLLIYRHPVANVMKHVLVAPAVELKPAGRHSSACESVPCR